MASAAKKAKLSTPTVKQACPYGAGCYRKNPAHIAEFSHDTVPSTSSSIASQSSTKSGSADSTASLPPCKYGIKCYRKNLLHFAEYSHPTFSSDAEKASTDNGSDGGDTDVCDSDEDKSKKDTSKGKDGASKDILSKGMSLLKNFSKMTEEERKELIQKAFEAQAQLQKELESAKKQMQEKEEELKKMQKEMNKGLLLVEGEKEALEGDKTVYFTMLPERDYKEGSADQIHFRLAESQFYRLIKGEGDSYRVTKVQYVVSPKLYKRFKAAKENLKNTRGEDLSYPVLAFHGTDDVNISPICENGFKMPGDQGFEEKTDAGWYGAGIYFSEYPAYSMDYITGADRLLLCQVLPGKVYVCKKITTGSKLTKGYDSHMSPCKKELVIFDAHCILPCYIVHYVNVVDDEFTYKKVTAGRKRIRKVGGPAISAGTIATKRKKALNAPCTEVFLRKAILVVAKKKPKNLLDLIVKHKGTIGTRTNSDLVVALIQEDCDDLADIDSALEKDVPIVTEEYIYECIFQKKFLDPDYFLHSLYDQ